VHENRNHTHQTDRDAVDRIVEGWNRQVPDFDSGPLQVFGRLNRVARLLDNNLRVFFQEHGLGIADYDLMAALFRMGPPYMAKPSSIARSSLLTSAGVTLRVDRMVKTGMVKRVNDLDDRRSVYVQLTDQGVDVVSRVALLNRERQRRMLDSLSAEDAAVLEDVFRKLEQSLLRPGWPDE
jgi:DNA-binding MarR family transcriptional regulator